MENEMRNDQISLGHVCMCVCVSCNVKDTFKMSTGNVFHWDEP